MHATKARTLTALFAALCGLVQSAESAARKPNIVYILCDDLGYGDVRCFNPEGKIATPHIDRVAAEGMRFTDMHSGSAVCTPTRYGIMTGRYSWRSRLQSGVLGGLSPRLIEPGRITVADLLRRNGYHTAALGKWHLGMDWVKFEGKSVTQLDIETADQSWNVDYSKPIANGPNSVGFDYYFGISASLDMIPYAFIENDRVTTLPTVEKAFPMMLGRAPAVTRRGPGAPDFDATDVLPTLIRKATEYLRARAAAAREGKPFFLYLPLASPHTPILPSPEWRNRSGLNPYADFVMQTDSGIGQVIRTIDELGLAADTLLIVTSDNGCSPQARYDELTAKGHNPSAVFRGHKADIFDGGHRIPFVARWPGKVKPGSSSNQTLCLVDFMATCADILGVRLEATTGEDSVSFLPALRSQARGALREAIVHHSINGSFAIRQGNWKLELCPDSGGWSAPRPGSDEAGRLPPIQLYDLDSDPSEKQNIQDRHPAIVAQLTALLEKYISEGRSTPGAPQRNTVTPRIRKP